MRKCTWELNQDKMKNEFRKTIKYRKPAIKNDFRRTLQNRKLIKALENWSKTVVVWMSKCNDANDALYKGLTMNNKHE